MVHNVNYRGGSVERVKVQCHERIIAVVSEDLISMTKNSSKLNSTSVRRMRVEGMCVAVLFKTRLNEQPICLPFVQNSSNTLRA